MNDNTTRHPNHPDNSSDREAVSPRQQVIPPSDALAEPTLAVDLATAEIDRLIATAHRYPRKLDAVVDQIKFVVLYDEAAAESSVYALPRGGKAIVGPSIGFANAVAGAWGNCWDDGHWLHTDRREKVVVSRGVFIDFQTGRRTTGTDQRRIVDNKGRLYNDDMIIVTSKACSAIARRNAILAGVPRPIWFPVYEDALRLVRGTEKMLPETRDKAIKALANFGIVPKQVLMYLGVKDIAEIGIEMIPTLRGMFAQLRDGTITPEEMFDPRSMMGRGFETVASPLADDAEDGAASDVSAGKDDHARNPAQAARDAEGTDSAADHEAAEAAAAAAKEQQAKAAAPAKAEPAKAKAEPAAKTEVKPAAEPKPAAAEPTEGAAQDGMPKTSEECVEFTLAWLDTAEERGWPSANIEENWKGQRKLREACSVVEDDFDKINARYRAVVKDAKAREAGAAGKK